jgi:hypothetical protein
LCGPSALRESPKEPPLKHTERLAAAKTFRHLVKVKRDRFSDLHQRNRISIVKKAESAGDRLLL